VVVVGIGVSSPLSLAQAKQVTCNREGYCIMMITQHKNSQCEMKVLIVVVVDVMMMVGSSSSSSSRGGG